MFYYLLIILAFYSCSQKVVSISTLNIEDSVLKTQEGVPFTGIGRELHSRCGYYNCPEECEYQDGKKHGSCTYMNYNIALWIVTGKQSLLYLMLKY